VLHLVDKMSWSDDDFDVDEEIAEHQKKKEEEEMTIDDIEEAAKKKAEAEAAAAPKAKKKVKKPEEEKEAVDSHYDVALQDPVAEKLRRQKLVEDADARMAADLFAGVAANADEKAKMDKEAEEAKKAKEAAAAAKKAAAAATKVQIEVRDKFDKIELKNQADVENLLASCVEKIDTGKHAGAASRFMTQIFKALVDQLNPDELAAVEKQAADVVKSKKVQKTEAEGAKRKNNEKATKNTKFDIGKEIADVHGGGEWGDDWDNEEWWDDATAAEYAPPKK